MKKLNKIFLSFFVLVLVIVPLFSGCTPNKEQTPQQSYTILRNLTDNYSKATTLSNSFQISGDMGKTEDKSFDYTSSNLSEEIINDLKSINFTPSLYTYKGGFKNYYNDTDKTGFKLDHADIYRTKDEPYKTASLNLTKNDGDKYVTYNFHNFPSTIEKIETDADYAKENYFYTFENLKADSPEVSGILDNILKYTTYDEFVNNDSKIASEIISAAFEMGISAEDIDVDTSIKTFNNYHKLTAIININNLDLEDPTSKQSILNLNAIIEIAFDDKEIIFISANLDAKQTSHLYSAFLAALLFQPTDAYTENDYVVIEGLIRLNYSINFKSNVINFEKIMDRNYDMLV